VTGFDVKELDDLLTSCDDDQANEVPPLPEHPISRTGDLWLCGDTRIQHRILFGDSTNAGDVSRLLLNRNPFLMVTEPSLRHRVGLTMARPRRLKRLRAGTGKLCE
jgi:hypothetical protein